MLQRGRTLPSHVKTNPVRFHHYGAARPIKLTETERRMMAARGWGAGAGGSGGLEGVKTCGDWLDNSVTILNTTELYP